ncbi:MAG: DUF5110 domain-containing protein [Chloroflexota bacterium]|nr:DUF5110 domain-containing protein [Chloroflexota bacterium]
MAMQQGDVATAYGDITVGALAPRIIRARLFGPPVVPEASYVRRDDWPGAPAARVPAPLAPGRYVATPHVIVRIDGGDDQPVRVTAFDGTGRPLLATTAAGGIAREQIINPATGAARDRVVVQLTRYRADVADDVHFYGLGQGGGAQLDRLGTSRVFWNSQVGHGPGVDFGIPLLVASAPGGAYGLFFDTTAAARLDTARGSGGLSLRYEADVPSLDLYFLAGPRPADVLEAYAELTGFPAMPPRWALGFLQSTRFFEQTEDILDLAREIRARQFPCDALIFLSTYGQSRAWNAGVGHLGLHPELWPDPPAVLRELQETLGFRVVTHEYPVLHPAAPRYAEAEARGFLLEVAYPAPPAQTDDGPHAPRRVQVYAENQRFIDFTNPEAREWWWEQHRHLVELGVAGWWLDGGEGPSGGSPMHRGDAVLLHNTFDLLRFTAFAEGEARDRPDGRPWMLCRSGAAGMQRLGAASWSGDINTTFTTLEAQVPLGLGLAMSGVPYWGTDIGGFYPAALDGELYARWFQFAAFCPVFRAHGWEWRRHLPWAHGPEIEAICRRYAELRLRLLPYLYSLAWEAHTRGRPLMRPLAFHYPADPNVWELGSQFLLGPDLLVAPVTRAGATQWPVYLPAGAWYDFWTGERFEGGRSVSAPSPIETIPLFARGGSIIPLGPAMQRTDERPLDDLTLLAYPGAPGEDGGCVIYEDDGRSQGYRASRYALTEVRAFWRDREMQVDIGGAVGEYPGQPAARDITIRVWLPSRPSAARVSRAGHPVDAVEREGAAGDGEVTWSYAASPWCEARVPDVARNEGVSLSLRW